MTQTTTVQRGSDVLFRELEDEIVLYRSTTGDAAVLDQLGSLVWHCLVEPASIADLAPDLAEAFATGSDAVARDLTELFEELASKSFIVEASVDKG